ncbi:VOC family protein [Mesorhizobium sp. CN2-181]|uniref:VOC family protein n=1 Tax=Mesorhizobium yinganensis TaxID=3157707 RepID=UPI0032B76AFF
MSINAIFANLSCYNLETSSEWYRTLFDREPDVRPMKGLCEWHLGETAGFQLFENPDKAGRGTLTLIVSDLQQERKRLAHAGIDVGDIEEADYTVITRLSDPDGNLIVLARHKH